MAKLKIELDTDDYKSENEIYESIIEGLQKVIKMNNTERKSKRWKPKLNDNYYFIDSTNKVRGDFWIDSHCGTNERRLKARNVFKTEEEAQFEAERRRVIAELEIFAEENNNDIDWENFEQCKYKLSYDHHQKKLSTVFNYREQCNATIYFSSIKLAEYAIKTVGEDRIKKYLFNVED